MANRKNSLLLTRRGFLGATGAALGSSVIALADEAKYPYLFVETIYLPLPGGGEYLAGVTLKLGPNDDVRTHELSLTIRAADFAPADEVTQDQSRATQKPPRLKLSGLVATFRDPAQAVPSNTRLTMQITGIDLFNHGNDDARGYVCRHIFTVGARDPRVEQGKAVWQIGLTTNAWIHDTIKHGNKFPPKAPGSNEALALQDVMQGDAGFRLELGPGWVRKTLSKIVGQSVAVTGNHYAVLSAEQTKDTKEGGISPSNDPSKDITVQWRWSVRPINSASRLSIFGGLLHFRTMRFGWGPNGQKDETSGKKDTAGQSEKGKSTFYIELGNEGPTPEPVREKALLARPNGRAEMPESRFLIRSDKNSHLAMACDKVSVVWDTEEHEAMGSRHSARVARLLLRGKFSVTVTSARTTLLKSVYTLEEGLHDAALNIDFDNKRKMWLLKADLPAKAAKIENLDKIAIQANPDNGVKESVKTQARQILSLGLGWLAMKSADGGRLMAEFPVGKVGTFGFLAPLAELPATLAQDAGDRTFCQISVVEPGIQPLFMLRNVVPPPWFDKHEAARIGHVVLDAPFAGASGVTTLDLPLDAALVKVRRSSDMLMLDFRLANLRMQSGAQAGRFVVYPDPIERPDDLVPADYPKDAVLRADFAPQHVAEQAFLRREGGAGGLPSLDFQKLAEAMGGDWPQKVEDAYRALREMSRSEKVGARRQLRELADAVFNALPPEPEKEPETEAGKNLLKYDPRLRARVGDFIAFAKTYDGSFRIRRLQFLWILPEDQRIYCGPDDLDPDVTRFAWDMRAADLACRLTAKLLERLISVDGSYGDTFVKMGAITIPDLRKTGSTIANLIPEASPAFENATTFEVSQADKAVIEALEGKPEDAAAQLKASEIKDRLAPDYAEFRALWRRQAEKLADDKKDPGYAAIADFVSIEWAVDGQATDTKIKNVLQITIAVAADPTNEANEPFPERSRARFSGPSRLAFQWARRHDPHSDAPQGDTPFSLTELLDWQPRDQMVTLRAQTARDMEPSGKIVRSADLGQQLRLQGFEPAADLMASSWMDKVYAAAATAPTGYETSIELPFRLHLSPAQDPVWIMPHEIALKRTMDNDLEDPAFGRPLWSVALEPADPDPLLRAVWSEDFWPERFRSAPNALNGNNDQLDQRDRDAIVLLNELDGPPQRGPSAPWYGRQLRRREGEIIDITPQNISYDERSFRAAMDPYDRDQIVAESSVPGILVKRGIDPQTKQIMEGGDSFSPPEGYEFIDLAVEAVKGADGQQVARLDSSAIYQPRALSFRELRLTALGGTLDLHTKFKPPVAATLLDGRSLYPALTLESWRHQTVLGRDRFVELVYKGYLFPFGHHASLVKLTERRYVQPPSGTKRGPTAYLVQRLFIRVSQPVKDTWYDQPDAGRAWPVGDMHILTGQTPDLVDPLPGPPGAGDDKPIKVQSNGRISLPFGRGLVFWPRTAPFEGAEVPFEFQIDGVAQAHSMPMIFVDNEAANDEQTVASLVRYYNELDSGAQLSTGEDPKRFFESKLVRKNKRVFDQGGVARRYGLPLEEGQTSYETLAWTVGAEGRPGENLNTLQGVDDKLTMSRGYNVSRRSNYGFSPLLLATDQPPFYPFVQFAEIRLDRLARLLGERQGRECLVAFETKYLKGGFAHPNTPSHIPEPMLGILSRAVLDAGDKGDRLGAIGRMAGRLLLIARKEGPLTTKVDEQLSEGHDSVFYKEAPPDFTTRLDPEEPEAAPKTQPDATTQPLTRSFTPAAQPADTPDVPKTLDKLLSLVLGDDDVTIFGSFKLKDLINIALMGLSDAVPKIREITEYAGGAAETVVKTVREQIVPALRGALAQADAAFDAAALKLGTEMLTVRSIYPDISMSMAALDKALLDFEQAGDDVTAGASITAIVAAAKALIKAFEKAGRDPISPLKLELRRVFLSEFKTVEDIERLLSDLLKEPSKYDQKLAEALGVGLTKLADALREKKDVVVQQIVTIMPLPELGSAGAAAIRDRFGKAAEEVVGKIYDLALDKVFSAPAPKTLAALIANVKKLGNARIIETAIAESASLKAIHDDLKNSLAAIDAKARVYWAQILLLYGQTIALVEEAKATEKSLKRLAESNAEALVKAEAKRRLEAIGQETERRAGRIADRATRALFGLDAKALRREATVIENAIRDIKGERNFGLKALKVIDLLGHIDRVFLRGRFGEAIQDAITKQSGPALIAILDGYTTVLDLADTFVEQAAKLVQEIDYADEVAAVEKALKDLATTVGEDGTAATLRALISRRDFDNADVDTLITNLGTKLDAIAKALKIDTVPVLNERFIRARMLVWRIARATGDAAKNIGHSTAGDTRKLAIDMVDIYADMIEQTQLALIAGAGAIGQARLAVVGWRDPALKIAEKTRAAIAACRENPLENYPALLATFPRAELSALLEIWPKTINNSVEVLQSVAVSAERNAEKFKTLLADAERIGATDKDLVRTALKAIETEIQQFGVDELVLAKSQLQTAAKNLAEALVGSPIEDLSAGARLIRNMSSARRSVMDALAQYPFLSPIADMFVEMETALVKVPDQLGLDTAIAAIVGSKEELDLASDIVTTVRAVKKLRDALQISGGNNPMPPDQVLKTLRNALFVAVANAESRLRNEAAAYAAAVVAALQNQVRQSVDEAETWLLAQVFASTPMKTTFGFLKTPFETMKGARSDILRALWRDEAILATNIGKILRFLHIAPDGVEEKYLPALLFVALPYPPVGGKTVADQKVDILAPVLLNEKPEPKDLLSQEYELLNKLYQLTPENSSKEVLAEIRKFAGRAPGNDLAVVQIIQNVNDLLKQILEADYASLVDFQVIRDMVEGELRKLLPTRLTTQFDYSVPLAPFPDGAPIFKPTGDSRFTMQSINTIDFSNPLKPTFEASAEALLSPFEIKLLGSFDAITLVFSAARLTWKLGGDPHFAIDFVDYRIGPALSFVEKIASALDDSGGGAYIRMASGFPGIEAGYRINIPAFTLGGATFLNIGLSAGAILPFDKRPAQFTAALSSREDPFVIIAGIWGGGGHFQLISDGRRITGFDASFVFGGGGGVTYGPLTMVGRVTIGVFIRKVGHYTEIAGDFYAGGSGKVAIFGISASLTVVTGMTGEGHMFGSAVFRYSFSIGWAKVSFAVTVFKKEGKGFSQNGQQQASVLDSPLPYLVAGNGETPVQTVTGPQAQIRISTARQDKNYGVWRSYFSRLRPEGY